MTTDPIDTRAAVLAGAPRPRTLAGEIRRALRGAIDASPRPSAPEKSAHGDDARLLAMLAAWR